MTKETVKTEKASVYEVGFHIVPAVSPEKLPAEVDAIKAILGAHGATIISEEFPQARKLAYTMLKVVGSKRSKYDTAYFGWIKFETTPEEIVEIKKEVDLVETVLRSLIIKTVRENTIYGPKVLPQEKEVREAVEPTEATEVVEGVEIVADEPLSSTN